MGQGAVCCVGRAEEEPLLSPVGPEEAQDLFFDCESGGSPSGPATAPEAPSFGGLPAAEGAAATAAVAAPVAVGGAAKEAVAEDTPGRPSPTTAAAADSELSPEQEQRYAELCRLLGQEPEPVISEHRMEDRRQRLLRFLRGEAWNAEGAFRRIHEHALWWRKYGMDDFREEDELDENGPMFVCGEDKCGRPTLVARPCVHFSRSREESIRAARRCVYTVWRCVQRYRPGVSQHDVIYDARGLNPRRNLDLAFSREVVDALGGHFPERVHRIIVINVHWTMMAFWTAISPLLHPMTKQKMTFCGSDFGDQLQGLVGPEHPYLRYALKVRGLSKREAAAVPLPPCAPFTPGREEDAGLLSPVEALASRQSSAASEANNEDGGCLSPQLVGLPSRQSTAASEADIFHDKHQEYAGTTKATDSPTKADRAKAAYSILAL